MNLAAVLPLSFVMIAGPQIISAVFLATSRRWGANSLAYVGGAALSVTTVVTIAYVVGEATTGGGGGGGDGTGETVIDWIILLLVVVMAVHTFLTRKTAEPPTWMGKLQGAEPKFALLLGLALLGVFPTDLAGSVTVGLHVARHGDAWWEVLPFIGLTLLLLGLPALAAVALGQRATRVLPAVRDWMNAEAWVVSEVVLVFFAAVTINSLVG